MIEINDIEKCKDSLDGEVVYSAYYKNTKEKNIVKLYIDTHTSHYDHEFKYKVTRDEAERVLNMISNLKNQN